MFFALDLFGERAFHSAMISLAGLNVNLLRGPDPADEPGFQDAEVSMCNIYPMEDARGNATQTGGHNRATANFQDMFVNAAVSGICGEMLVPVICS